MQCLPGSSPSSVLHTKATGKASIVVGSPSLGTAPRNIDLVRGYIASSLAICRVSISGVVDDVAALVYFQHGHELDDVHSGRQRVTEMHHDAQVALLYQIEAGAIALVGVQVKTEERVAVPEVAVRQSVPPPPPPSCHTLPVEENRFM